MKKRKGTLIALVILWIIWLGFRYCDSKFQDSSSREADHRIFIGEVSGYEFQQNNKLLILSSDNGLNEYRFIINEDVLFGQSELEERISNNETDFFVKIYSEYLLSEWNEELIFPATFIEPYSSR